MSRNITPKMAVERYLKERSSEIANSTAYNHNSLLSDFTEWCDRNDIEFINDLEAWDIGEYKVYREEECGISGMTLYNQMTTLKVFIKWCESRGVVDNLSERMLLPDREDAVRTETLDSERAAVILQYCTKYAYASLKHVLFALLWDTGFRLGTAHALDVDDYHSDEQYVEVNHRPDEGTPLKNKEGGEREVNLHAWVCEIIDDYLADQRPDVTDEYDREPLLATRQGRAHTTTLRQRIYCLTRPCAYGEGCPYDRHVETCEANTYKHASKCPDSLYPHAIRRGAITEWLDGGHSKELVSDRMDVSKKVLDKHYDTRSESEKRQLRREMFGMDREDPRGL